MLREPLQTQNVYHVYNRGTDKRLIFLDDADRVRFLENLYDFNDAMPALRRREKSFLSEVEPRTKLVEILAYCLMPNHYHLMIRQAQDGGASRFMKKIGTGYTMYFNQRYKRSGVLFQGRFKSIVVDRDEYLRYLPHYIHLNPREIVGNRWQTYRWSSYKSYLNPTISSGLLDAHILETIYRPQKYREALADWVRDISLVESLAPVLLD